MTLAAQARQEDVGAILIREDGDPLVKREPDRWDYIDPRMNPANYTSEQVSIIVKGCGSWSFS